MGLENLDERLKAQDEKFKNAPEGGGFPQLPEPGWYSCILRAVDFFEAKSNGAAFLKIIYEVALDAKYQGTNIEVLYNLEPGIPFPDKPAPTEESIEQTLGFLKKDLRTLGIDVDDPSFGLEYVVPGSVIWDGLLDVPVAIDVVDSKKVNPTTNKPYRNAYLRERLGEPLEMAAPAESGADNINW